MMGVPSIASHGPIRNRFPAILRTVLRCLQPQPFWPLLQYLRDSSCPASRATHTPTHLAFTSYESKRARPPWDCTTETPFESKETNSSAPTQSPSYALIPSANSPPS